jgi:hypothetical protein
MRSVPAVPRFPAVSSSCARTNANNRLPPSQSRCAAVHRRLPSGCAAAPTEGGSGAGSGRRGSVLARLRSDVPCLPRPQGDSLFEGRFVPERAPRVDWRAQRPARDTPASSACPRVPPRPPAAACLYTPLPSPSQQLEVLVHAHVAPTPCVRLGRGHQCGVVCLKAHLLCVRRTLDPAPVAPGSQRLCLRCCPLPGSRRRRVAWPSLCCAVASPVHIPPRAAKHTAVVQILGSGWQLLCV